MRGLYIHIPFCKHICNYCDFPKRIAINYKQIEDYVNFIINDLDNYTSYYSSVKTIYIGGGTPNILDDNLLELLLKKIKSLNISYDEYSIELNPELVTENQAKLLKEYGVNRISLGVESFNDQDLIRLNRHHTKDISINAINILKKVGFNNINVDLIFAHPFDTLDKIKENLNIFYSLKIPHLSYYSMILEDKTVFNHVINKNELELLSNDTEALMYEFIINDLKKHGYHHYETSNFAIFGYESKHNLLYWDSLEYIGIGCGASGYLDSIRYTNSKVLKEYYNNVKETETLSLLDKKKEFMMLGFRKIDGIELDVYKKRFNTELLNDFDLTSLIDKGLISVTSKRITLTKKGIMLANEVFMEFV